MWDSISTSMCNNCNLFPLISRVASLNETVPIHITSLRCSGFESSLVSCPHEVADNGTCQHDQDIYLYCSEY